MLPPPLHCKSPSIRQTQTPSLTPSLGMLTKQSLKGDFVLVYRQLRKSLKRMVHFHSHQVFLDVLMLIFSVSCYLQLNFSPRRTANHIVLLHMLSDENKNKRMRVTHAQLFLTEIRFVLQATDRVFALRFMAERIVLPINTTHGNDSIYVPRSHFSPPPQSLLLLGISPLFHPQTSFRSKGRERRPWTWLRLISS